MARNHGRTGHVATHRGGLTEPCSSSSLEKILPSKPVASCSASIWRSRWRTASWSSRTCISSPRALSSSSALRSACPPLSALTCCCSASLCATSSAFRARSCASALRPRPVCAPLLTVAPGCGEFPVRTGTSTMLCTSTSGGSEDMRTALPRSPAWGGIDWCQNSPATRPRCTPPSAPGAVLPRSWASLREARQSRSGQGGGSESNGWAARGDAPGRPCLRRASPSTAT